MIKEINQQIIEINKIVLGKDKVKSRINELEKDISKKKSEISIFYKKLLKEKKDVEQLQKLSLQSIFASFLGGKEQKLSKEQNEYMQAKVINDRLNDELDTFKESLSEEKSKMKEIKDNEIEYMVLLRKKKELMMGIKVSLRDSLNDYTIKIDRLNRQLIDVNEALQEGRNLSTTLDALLKKLRSASNWGTYDIFTSKSIISSMIKHDRINDANRLINRMKLQHKKYKKELKDVHMNIGHIDLKFSSNMKTFDIVFDNIFTDFAVQKKINNALNTSQRINSDLISSLRELKFMKPKVKKELQEAENNLERIILDFE